MINTEPLALKPSEIANVLKNNQNLSYICDHDLNGLDCWSVFYSKKNGVYYAVKPSPSSGLYISKSVDDFETYKIHAVVANDGEIIYSRYPMDYRESKDQTVWVDGGCTNKNSVMHPNSKIVLVVRDGILQGNGEHW